MRVCEGDAARDGAAESSARGLAQGLAQECVPIYAPGGVGSEGISAGWPAGQGHQGGRAPDPPKGRGCGHGRLGGHPLDNVGGSARRVASLVGRTGEGASGPQCDVRRSVRCWPVPLGAGGGHPPAARYPPYNRRLCRLHRLGTCATGEGDGCAGLGGRCARSARSARLRQQAAVGAGGEAPALPASGREGEDVGSGPTGWRRRARARGGRGTAGSFVASLLEDDRRAGGRGQRRARPLGGWEHGREGRDEIPCVKRYGQALCPWGPGEPPLRP